ncbi:MAG: DNA polymerase III subunit alpha [Minisyncoccia bacterium]
MAKFTHLHLHSEYSLLDGLPKIEAILKKAKEIDQESVALTDHGVLYGVVEFYKKAKELEIKPIIGCEMYLAFEKMELKRPNIDDKKYHIVLLVKNEEGYKNLVKLVTKAHLEGFYYKPRIDEELLAQHSSGLIALSACLQGKIPQLVLANKIKEAKETALKYKEIFGKDNFYLELQRHPNILEQEKVNKVLIEFSRELDIPLVATNDVHYLKKEDAKIQDILMLINTDAKPNDPERLTMLNDDFSMRSSEEMIEVFKDIPEAIENTQKIAQMCNFEFKLGKTILPPFETPDNISPVEYLRHLYEKNLEKKYGKNPPKEVIERLNYELGVIERTGFSTYFLIVQDFVNWAKEHRIVVGPGRGSVGGSLVAYLLNITEIDPLKYNLLFERFLNEQRISMPDIDLDFTDRRRDEVIEYVAQKYGRNKVAQIATFGRMAARAVVRDVGRALGYQYSFCDKIAKLIPFGSTLEEALSKISELRDLYKSDEKVRQLIDISKKLEGCARHISTHACGVVISAVPLEDIIPLQHPSQKENTIITQYEMHTIEDLGLLKIDFLGLKNLTIIEDTLSRIYEVRGEKVDIKNLPENDHLTFKLLQEGKTTGVFQFESEGMKRILRELKPSNLEEISAVLALYRPGPMKFVQQYINRKNGKEKVVYLHEKLKPILEKTYGICIYQEQLMEIAKAIAGFSLNEADILRKAIGKKMPELLKAQKEKFIEGAVKNNVKKEIAKQIWQWILPFAQYGFNKSHSIGYAIISYQTAFLKAHYPVEFMAALLTSEKNDIERIAVLIEECKEMGIQVLPPDINESYRNFSVIPGENKIRFGLLAIKNVGENIVEVILAERKKNGPFKSFEDFIKRIQSKDLNKKSLESLIKSGVFDKFEERNKLLENIEEILRFSRQQKNGNNNGQFSLFDGNNNFTNFSSNSLFLKSVPPAKVQQKLSWEKELLGLYITSHPLQAYQKILQKKAYPLNQLKNGFFPQKIRVGGLISSLKKIFTKNGKPMVFLKLEDLTDKAEVIVFPSILEKHPMILQENKIVFVVGKVESWHEIPKIIADSIEEIIDEG